MKSLKTFYDTLQVPRDANIAALRTAHKALTEQLQPERNAEDPGAAARQMLLVNKALEVLIHPDARKAYDAWLNAHSGPSDVPTLPELVEPPSTGGNAPVSSEPLAPLPTLDLEGFAAEVAAKAKASAKANPPQTPAAAPAPQSRPAPLSSAPSNPVTALQPSVAKPAAPSSAAPLTASAPVAAPKAPAAPSTASGFAETQPYAPADVEDLPDLQAPARKAAAAAAASGIHRPAASAQTAARQSAPMRALDWLRERPVALVAVALAGVLLLAFAPWLWRATAGAFKKETPVIAPLQPTYVEPSAEAVSAPAPAPAPASEPVAEPAVSVEEPSPTPPAATEPVRKKVKPRPVVKRVAEPKRAQAPVAPAPEPEPAPAPAPVDTGGHSGFAPKCRWVTPTNWSCK